MIKRNGKDEAALQLTDAQIDLCREAVFGADSFYVMRVEKSFLGTMFRGNLRTNASKACVQRLRLPAPASERTHAKRASIRMSMPSPRTPHSPRGGTLSACRYAQVTASVAAQPSLRDVGFLLLDDPIAASLDEIELGEERRPVFLALPPGATKLQQTLPEFGLAIVVRRRR